MVYLDTNVLIYASINQDEAKHELSLNDAIHVAYAQRFAHKLVTFDKDFTAFQNHTSLMIDVLR